MSENDHCRCAGAAKVTAKVLAYGTSEEESLEETSETDRGCGRDSGADIHMVHPNKRPLKIIRKRKGEAGESFQVPPIISGTVYVGQTVPSITYGQQLRISVDIDVILIKYQLAKYIYQLTPRTVRENPRIK